MLDRVINRDLPYVGDVMSNFDHVIEKDLETELKLGGNWGTYSAYNFHADICFEDNKFICEIWRYGGLIDIITEDTLEDIMDNASSSYGQE